MRYLHGRLWVSKILPLVYDESISYYEVLCKVYEYLNKLIENDKALAEEMEEIRQALSDIQEWIDNFDTTFIKEIVDKYIATMIFVGISDSGYIIYNVPSSWKHITFNTTGLDIELKIQPEYGHLVLSY